MLVDRAARRVHELTNRIVAVETIIRRGETVNVLVALSEVADRVVLQHRQLPRLERIFTGSVALGVAGRSTVPVVSVPEQWRSGLRTARITVGVADSSKDRRLLETAFATASALQGTLTLLNAWFLPSIYDDAIVSATALHEWTVEAETDIRSLAAELLKAYPSVSTEVQIKHMRPADALVEASRHSDLIMLGRSRSGHRYPHLGSLTRAIIRESLCPVEVIPIHKPANDERRDSATTAAEAFTA